jgi:hypothetical protein
MLHNEGVMIQEASLLEASLSDFSLQKVCFVIKDSLFILTTLHKQTNLKRSSSNIPCKSAILKRHRRTPKIRILQRIPRSSRQTLPRNQWLLSTLLSTQPHLVIHRPDAKIRNKSSRSRGQEGGTAVPVSVG